MADRFTERTHNPWGGRVLSSFKGMIFGVILFIGAFFLLSWNEGRSVDRAVALEQAHGTLVRISTERADPANNGKAVYLSGRAEAVDDAQDDVFGLRQDALKLERTVRMYQWKESTTTKTEEKLGGGEVRTKTYRYDKGWHEQAIDSQNFKHPEGHQNPRAPYGSKTFTAAGLHVGAFTLSDEFSGKIGNFQPLPLSGETHAALPPALQEKFRLEGDEYVTGNPDSPAVGDLRVSFKVAPETNVSLIGAQEGSRITPWTAANGDKLSLLETRTVPPEELIRQAEEQNALLTWLFRVSGFLAMWFGLVLLLEPLAAIGRIVPFLGGFLSLGATVVTFLVAAPLSLVTIALAWIAVRPVIGATLLAAAFLLFFGGILRTRRNTAATRPV